MPEKAVEKKEKFPMVQVEVVVDIRNTHRKLVRATPSTCLECGFNVIVPKEGEDMPEWEELSPEEQAAAKGALRSHVKKVHPYGTNDAAVVKEENIAGSWLQKPRPI